MKNRILEVEYLEKKELSKHKDRIIYFIEEYKINHRIKKTIKYYEEEYLNEPFKTMIKSMFLNQIHMIPNSDNEISNMISYIIEKNLTIESFEEIFFDMTMKISDSIEEDYEIEKSNKLLLINIIKKVYANLLNNIYKEYTIRTETLKKNIRKDVEREFFYIYNRSSSDILNNYLGTIETQNITLSTFLTKIKNNLIEIYDKKEFIEDESVSKILSIPTLTDITDKKSLLKQKENIREFYNTFSSLFSNEETLIYSKNLDFIFNYMRNCFKFLSNQVSRSIKSNYINNLDKEIVFKMHEFSLMLSIFMIYKNAVERNPTETEINLYNDNLNVYIDIKNNGQEIERENREYLFLEFFTTKKNIGAYGMGLSIRVNELDKYDGKLSFVSSTKQETIFRITIPKYIDNKNKDKLDSIIGDQQKNEE